jgi:hypothetical protein
MKTFSLSLILHLFIYLIIKLTFVYSLRPAKGFGLEYTGHQIV